jgi:hypothetical protein
MGAILRRAVDPTLQRASALRAADVGGNACPVLINSITASCLNDPCRFAPAGVSEEK